MRMLDLQASPCVRPGPAHHFILTSSLALRTARPVLKLERVIFARFSDFVCLPFTIRRAFLLAKLDFKLFFLLIIYPVCVLMSFEQNYLFFGCWNCESHKSGLECVFYDVTFCVA